MKPSAVAVLIVFAAALLVAGCGGGSGSSGETGEGPSRMLTEGGAPATGAPEGGAPKKATAPNAPAGSKVVACSEGREETLQLRATAVDCGAARTTMQHWESSQACTLANGASRSSCSLGGFRCQAVKADRGAAVSCARRGGDISFVARAWPLKRAGSG
jgi:hypothetical protein